MRDVIEIETERLILRAVTYADTKRIALFLADPCVSRMVSSVPDPYPAIAAEGWLMTMRARAHLGEDFVFAIELPGEGLIGVIGLHKRNGKFMIGYWVGKPYWGAGYATEALRAFVAEAQVVGDLEADHFVDNPASGRVLEKAGFKPTGVIEPAFSLARGEKAPLRKLKRARVAHAVRRDQMEACLA